MIKSILLTLLVMLLLTCSNPIETTINPIQGSWIAHQYIFEHETNIVNEDWTFRKSTYKINNQSKVLGIGEYKVKGDKLHFYTSNLDTGVFYWYITEDTLTIDNDNPLDQYSIILTKETTK